MLNLSWGRGGGGWRGGWSPPAPPSTTPLKEVARNAKNLVSDYSLQLILEFVDKKERFKSGSLSNPFF